MKTVIGFIRTQAATTLHKLWVAYYLVRYLPSAARHERWALLRRAVVHDLSKYRWDEACYFARHVHELGKVEYGTPEYRLLLVGIKPCIQRHYRRNSHHPEHHERGFAGMSWLDKVEMVADWAAAVKRHTNGSLEHSIEINAQRFGYDERDKLRLARIAVQMGAL